MEYMSADDLTSTQGKILCCACGLLIDPNPSNMCVNCLRSNCDITQNIAKSGVIYWCKGCERYMHSQGNWVVAALESKELLSLCLKKIKNLNEVHLVDASFIWTEPHSKRLKVKLTVQKEVAGGAVLQQVFTVEFVVNNQMCIACHRREAKDYWRALVQVRQKVNHKKTFFYLEQLILKHQAHSNCLFVKATPDGVDFFFDKKDDAKKFVEFLQTVVACRFQASQQLISHDTHNNTYTYKHTFCVEIVPICKDDLVCLPAALASSLGCIGQLCICIRVTNFIYLLDPFTLKKAELRAAMYWRYPFTALASGRQLTEYLVMSIEPIRGNTNRTDYHSTKHVMADVYVKRACDVGKNESDIHTRSHLGHLLNPFDRVMGYDMVNMNWNDPDYDKYEMRHLNNIPDVILIKKWYGDKATRKELRRWKLKRLQVVDETGYLDDNSQGDWNNYGDEFLEDLEEDPALRENVNIYLDKSKRPMAVDTDDFDCEELPQITLAEMLDELELSENDV